MKSFTQSSSDRAELGYGAPKDAMSNHRVERSDEPFRVRVELHGPEWQDCQHTTV